MPVQHQAQSHIQCSGHPCIHGQKQQEEEAHQEGPQIKEVAVVVKVIIKVVNRAHHRQEEEQDQEEAQDQEEPDHLHQEEDMEEAAQHRGEPHHSSQEEEQAIQGPLHLHLQVFHSPHVHQIHGVHLIDPGKLFQS